MYEWDYAVQSMIDWIEHNIREQPTLDRLAKEVGYSRYYCSSQFRKITGMTIRNYIAGRKLYYATIRVRDTKDPILEIALEHGYSSQGALTRAFQNAYGCTPAAYRKKPVPIPFSIHKTVLNPSHYIEKRTDFDRIEGLLDSMIPVQHPVVWSHHAGWFYENEDRGYEVLRPIRKIVEE